MFLNRGFRFLRIAKLIRQNIQSRSVHPSATCGFKKYQSVETDLISKFVPKYDFEELSESKQTQEEFKHEENYSDKKEFELVKAFENLSFHCQLTNGCISESIYDNLISSMIDKFQYFSDKQLVQVLLSLKRFPPTPSIKSNNFYPLWVALEYECCRRIPSWKTPTLLKFCNLFSRLHLSKVCKFTGRSIMKIARRIHQLSPNMFVETMFYLTTARTKIPMVDAERHFLDIMDELNINEISIVSLAFFKTESKLLNHETISKIYSKIIENIDSISEISLVSILKILRYSSKPQHDKDMELLSNAILPHMHKFGLISCLHIALIGTNLQYLHTELLKEIVLRFSKELKSTRLKDMERISFVISLFDFNLEGPMVEELLKNIVEELKLRVDEIVQYPKCFPATVHYLSIFGVYDEEFIKSVLKEKFIDFAYGEDHSKIGREILCLDSFTRINLKSVYNGPQLSSKLRSAIAKHQSFYVPYKDQSYKLTHNDKLLLNLKEVLEDKYGYNLLTHVLPHYQRPDIVYCFDENGKSVTKELLDAFPENYSGEIISKDLLFAKKKEFADNSDKYRMVAILLGGWNFFIRNTTIPTGGLRMKLEQLEMIGYKPILIPWIEWIKYTDEEKEQFIDNEIKRALA